MELIFESSPNVYFIRDGDKPARFARLVGIERV